MADNQLQSNKPGKKDLSMEQRLLLAFVLMGLVLFLTPYFYKAPPPPPKTPRSGQQPDCARGFDGSFAHRFQDHRSRARCSHGARAGTDRWRLRTAVRR